MSEPTPEPEVSETGLTDIQGPKTLKQLVGDESMREYFDKIRDGLRHPKDSGEYKYAIHQVVRVWAPIAGIVLPVLLTLAVMLAPETSATSQTAFSVEVMNPDALNEQLDDIKELETPDQPQDVIEPPKLEEFTAEQIQNMSDEQLTGGAVGPSVGPGAGPTDSGAEFSPQPAAFDTVAMIKSPIKMTGIYGSRTPGARGAALAQYGGGGGGGSGGAATEHAVYLALRWLKKNQNPDGSWPNNKAGMTGLALLTYLAHGETPASEEFGPTVEKAIKWLVANQNSGGEWPGANSYPHAIATYAVCEAYAMTKIPMLKDAAEKAALIIIKGQNPTGGWNYNWKVETPPRDDTSLMGWCAQALKAAKMAGIQAEGMDACMKKAILGFKKNYANREGYGGFGYTEGSTTHGLTGTGTLCMQLLGQGKSAEVKSAMRTLETVTFLWDAKPGEGKMNNNYYWYYITQAKFHEGGPTWQSWNKLFSPVLVKNQTIIPDAIADAKGELVDIGFWDMAKEGIAGHTDGPVMNTCLCALQLQVYYRYLPTFKTPDAEEAGPGALSNEKQDVDIQIL